jgi:hypothetical protein
VVPTVVPTVTATVTPATPPVMVTATAPAPPTGRGGTDTVIWVLPSGALIVLLAGLLLRWVGRAAGR